MEVDCLLMDSSGNVLSSSKVSKLPSLIMSNEEVYKTFDCVFNHSVTVSELESYSINIHVSQDTCFLSGSQKKKTTLIYKLFYMFVHIYFPHSGMANSPSSFCQGVMFNFSTDEPLDGLVRGVIFST